ncbi:MAG: hypothetical protein KME29_36510 [Calothrix sp. FI2-JRJ7]|jgi:hypothetical protein|nr:hypothetical protein [Calothrix sp. FI2-JRJ7]
MTEAQLTAIKIPVFDLIEMITAVRNHDYTSFQDLESSFVSQHGEDVWQEVFNFRIMPVLDQDTSQWLSAGINSVKNIA